MAWNSTIFHEFYLERVGSMVIILYSLRLKLSWRRCACLLWRAKLAQNGGIVLSNGIKLRLKSTLKTEFNSNNWVSKWTCGITFFKDPMIGTYSYSIIYRQTFHFCSNESKKHWNNSLLDVKYTNAKSLSLVHIIYFQFFFQHTHPFNLAKAPEIF